MILAGLNSALLAKSPPADTGEDSGESAPRRNAKLVDLEPNKWLKLHEQGKDDKVRFRRQGHGGSCFDTKRNRLILFGSDTHGRNWYNSPFIFDPVKAEWSQLYPHDARETYAVNEKGIPVAGPDGEHPWATHTFGAVEYDPSRDEMIVACPPHHMVPGRFTNSVKELWPKIKKHPTWTLDLKTNKWRALPCEPVSFFPHSTCFDTDRNVVIGYRPDGIYELGGKPRQWTRKVKQRVHLLGWHGNTVYDARHKASVTFGYNKNSNDIDAYFVESGKLKLMPAEGKRPPKDQHNPMAFEPRIGQTVIVIDRNTEPDKGRKGKRVAETWCYDLGADRWTQIETATLPFGCDMNYNMHYDPLHKCLLLVTGGYGNPTAVRALRIELGK
jgi:hypothetical protein